MDSAEVHEFRLKNVEASMAARGIRCLLLNQSQSIEFLTGAKNTCSWVFLTDAGQRIALVLESDYRDYQKQSFLTDIRTFTAHDPLDHFRRIPVELGIGDRELAIEKGHLRLAQFEMVERFIGSKINPQFDADLVVQEARIIKTPDEVSMIKKASELAAAGIHYIQQVARKGMSEAQLAHETCEMLIEKGAGYDTYIYLASGQRSSLAHAHPSNNLLEEDPLIVDIHASFHGYHADMARTLFVDEKSREQIDLYTSFREKVLDTIHSLVAGIDLIAVKKQFYSGFENHGDWIFLTGPLLHGVGIVNYELPVLDHPFEGKGFPPQLMAGMTLACTNIGMYSRRGWGLRYEDTLVLNPDGVDILTQEKP